MVSLWYHPSMRRSKLTEEVLVALARDALRTGEAQLLRQEAGLTDGDIAAIVNVARPTVWRWFAGQRVPQGSAALRLAQLLVRLGLKTRGLAP
jgi:DNA-binding transcriptional regulator YiaG